MFKRKGTLLLEVIIATGIAASFTTAVVHLALLSNEALSKVETRGEANFYAQQGVASVMTIDFADLTPVVNGKTVFDGTKWNIGSGQETLSNGMIRSISIEAVGRDGSCLPAGSGGATDADSKKITSSVSWTDITGVNKTVTHTRHRTNWQNPIGSCFAGTMADNIDVDLTGVSWGGGGLQLNGVTITNSGSAAVGITHMRVSWNPSVNRRITGITFNDVASTVLWTSLGPGAPLGNLPSGTLINTVDRSIGAGVSGNFNPIVFDNNMVGRAITIVLTFSDTSTLTIGPFTP
jgi:hypothetical protein